MFTEKGPISGRETETTDFEEFIKAHKQDLLARGLNPEDTDIYDTLRTAWQCIKDPKMEPIGKVKEACDILLAISQPEPPTTRPTGEAAIPASEEPEEQRRVAA